MTIGSDIDLAAMRRVGRLVAQTLAAMRAEVRPGVTTAALDLVGERVATAAGARSAPRLTYGFPGFNCISVNDEIVHGIPGPRVLAPGDVVKLDVTLELDGYMADSAITVIVPPASREARLLQRAARIALDRGIDAARAGRPLRAIGAAIESAATREGATVVRDLCGHGIGRRLHEEPSVPNWPAPTATSILHDGLVLAIEPMLTTTDTRVIEAADGWTYRTDTHAIAVHQEHTVVVRHGTAIILTAA